MQLSNDLTSTSNQAFQWKMIFNPDLKIRAQKVIFGRKSKIDQTLLFNNTPLNKNTADVYLFKVNNR